MRRLILALACACLTGCVGERVIVTRSCEAQLKNGVRISMPIEMRWTITRKNVICDDGEFVTTNPRKDYEVTDEVRTETDGEVWVWR